MIWNLLYALNQADAYWCNQLKHKTYQYYLFANNEMLHRRHLFLTLLHQCRNEYQSYFWQKTELRDRDAHARISVRLGNFGVINVLGDGVNELKIDHGPGYRLYYAMSGKTVYYSWLVETKPPRRRISRRPRRIGSDNREDNWHDTQNRKLRRVSLWMQTL